MEEISKKIFTVSELTYSIKSLLETNFQIICVKGEIGNFKKHTSGHIYFNIKDERSQISAALFRGNISSLEKLPKSGDQVIVTGEISLYPPRGSYQIIVKRIDFLGIGELLLKLHKLKEELKSLGYFDEKNKKKLPPIPKRIGVVTSESGAVIEDILNVLKRRFKNFHLILNPVSVQGDGAAEEIAKAIDDFNRYNLADVLIVGRGGGSMEDLFSFNERGVAEAIFRSKIPIISAVGHETDTSISDLVADLRAPTPSAAAELVILEKASLLKRLEDIKEGIYLAIQNKKSSYRERILNFSKQRALFSKYAILFDKLQRVDEMKASLQRAAANLILQKRSLLISNKKLLLSNRPENKISNMKDKITAISLNIESSIKRKLEITKNILNGNFKKELFERSLLKELRAKKRALENLLSHMRSLDPKKLLKKGYSILFLKKDDSIIISSKKISKNEKVSALLSDGKIDLTVD